MDRGFATISITQTARRQAASMLAFFAILLHIAVPTLYDLAPPTTQGLMEMTICAGGEAKQILVDESGKPAKEIPTSKHNCNGCLSHCGVLVLFAATALLPQLSSLYVLPLISGRPQGFAVFSTQARAPPL